MTQPPPRDAHTSKDARKTGRRKSERPAWRQRLIGGATAWAAIVLVWILRLTCRIRVVEGGEHVDAALASRLVVVPCGWHQRIITSGLFLRSLIPRGMRMGFLISPSREGDMIARVASAHSADPIRGSSSRTGREAMRALTQAVADGISPMMYGDGPRGPAHVFKPGAVILASRTGAPLWLVGCAASRYWQMKSWDRGQIPKPFALLTIAIDTPWYIDALEGTQQAEDIGTEIGQRLDALDDMAQAAQRPASKSA